MFKALFGRKSKKKSARVDPHVLYGVVVARARMPEFYRDLGVPDTFDGRFEMMVMHVYLVLRRLKREEPNYRDFSQNLFDTFIDDISIGLREAGVGDSVMPKRLQKMSRVFYGRAKAWDSAFEDGTGIEAFVEIMTRNLYPETQEVPDLIPLVNYFMAEEARISMLTSEEVLCGDAFPVAFPANTMALMT